MRQMQAAPDEERYANLYRQSELAELLNEFGDVILAMSAGGETAKQISTLFGVSRECISRRLRPHGLVTRRGRPSRATNRPSQ